ncbi:hypothetical protein ZWY2020_054378 [Hordeum vulgare]|nr:hypothetical protein ZWY2020_054378 [Hordeum vulgare]
MSGAEHSASHGLDTHLKRHSDLQGTRDEGSPRGRSASAARLPAAAAAAAKLWRRFSSEEAYPSYANGPGYVISSDNARYIVSEFDSHTLRLFKMEDVRKQAAATSATHVPAPREAPRAVCFDFVHHLCSCAGFPQG